MRDEHYAGDDRLIDIDDLKEKIIDSGRALDVLEHRAIVAAGQTDRDEVLMRNGHRGEANPSCGWHRNKGTFIDRADASYNGSLIDVIAHTDGLSLPDQLPAVCKIIADELGIELLRMDGTPYDGHGAAAIDPAERSRRAEQRRTEVEQRRAERQAKADKEAAAKAQRFATKILPTHWDNAVRALDHPLADEWANMRGIPPRTLDDPNVRIAEDLPFQKFGKYPTIVGSMRKDGPAGDITGLAVIRFEALPGGGVNLNPRFEHR